ncbi:MAG TPA: NUDIX hydrolase [Vicinamibacterales bacterium]|nr:NUDIX hydrolase [Vicinamibacterales bacterium]
MAVVFTGKKFSVEVEEIGFPNGQTHRKEIVRHVPSIVLIPLTDDGRILLCRQYRAPLAKMMWELSAGGVEPGETPEEAARRECEEEMRLVPGTLERLGTFYPAPGFCDEQLTFFRARNLTSPPPDSPNKPDEDEDIHVEAFTIADANGMVARGEIVDLKTAYGLSLI